MLPTRHLECDEGHPRDGGGLGFPNIGNVEESSHDGGVSNLYPPDDSGPDVEPRGAAAEADVAAPAPEDVAANTADSRARPYPTFVEDPAPRPTFDVMRRDGAVEA